MKGMDYILTHHQEILAAWADSWPHARIIPHNLAGISEDSFFARMFVKDTGNHALRLFQVYPSMIF